MVWMHVALLSAWYRYIIMKPSQLSVRGHRKVIVCIATETKLVYMCMRTEMQSMRVSNA